MDRPSAGCESGGQLPTTPANAEKTLLDARRAQLDGYLAEDAERTNIAMVDVATLIRRSRQRA
jgi:hypothetical protein